MADGRVTVTAKFDARKMAELLRSPAGPVYRFMIRKGDEIVAEARREAPVGKVDMFGRGHPGNLRASIVKRIQTGDEVTIFVVAEAKYALWVHEGSVPHRIPASRKALVFEYPTGSGQAVRIPVGRAVNHPGTHPNRFLIRAAQNVLGTRYVRSA